jgi:imidazolonepropionase-like amidohydrolase
MKRVFRILLIVVFIIAVIGFTIYRSWIYNPYPDRLILDPQQVFSKESNPPALLIRNTNLINVETGKVIPETDVLIQSDTIAGVFYNEEPDVPPGTLFFDGRDQYLIPGLFDVHVHLAMYWHLISGNFAPEDSLVTKAALEQFVRYGVTTILVLGGGGANDEQTARLKQLEKSRKIVAPLIFAVGDQITVPGSHPVTTIMRLPEDTDPGRLHQAGVRVIGENEDPSPMIARKKEMGLDGVKIIIEKGPPPFYPKPRMSVETAGRIVDSATGYDLPVYVHTESFAEFKDAVSLDIRGIMHSVSDSLIRDELLISRMKREKIWYVPTLSLFYGFQYFEFPERLDADFLQAGISRRMLRSLQHPLFRWGFGTIIRKYDVSGWLATSMENLAHLHDKGVRVALGTDTSTPFNFPGYNVHIEMELMSEAGISNAEVLRIATINSAEFLGIQQKVGTISPGKIANLLILNKNPLDNIRNTRTLDKVILKGRLIDPIK